jgi:hypothetical protein
MCLDCIEAPASIEAQGRVDTTVPVPGRYACIPLPTVPTIQATDSYLLTIVHTVLTTVRAVLTTVGYS